VESDAIDPNSHVAAKRQHVDPGVIRSRERKRRAEEEPEPEPQPGPSNQADNDDFDDFEPDYHETPKRQRSTTDEEDFFRYRPTSDEINMENTNYEDGEENLKYFCETKFEDPEVNKTYSMLFYDAVFNLKNINKSKNASGLLLKIFEKYFDRAKSIAARTLRNPGMINVILDSPVLDRGNIGLDFKSYRHNTPLALLRRFKGVSMSHENPSLLGEDITMSIMIASPHYGRGRNNFPGLYNKDALIQFKNPDRYCLFYSVFLTYTYLQLKENARLAAEADENQDNTQTNKKKKQRQYRIQYRESERISRRMAKLRADIGNGNGLQYIQTMLDECGIPLDEPSYSPKIHLPKVQDWLTFNFPYMNYKIFVYKSTWSKLDYYKAFWIGEGDLGEAIPIFYNEHEEHFYGIKNMNSLFARGKKYCFSCQGPYESNQNHSLRCKGKCHSCNQMGVGFPCKWVEKEQMS